MIPHSIRHVLAAIFLVMAFGAQAQDTLPPPVNGITFEEWAAANARLSNQQPLADVLKVLNVDEAKWNQSNQAFLDALKAGDPASHMFARYAEVFADPAVGRFSARSDTPQIVGKLATFADYADVQADLAVSSEFGKDPQAVLKAHNLTVYEFSQEAKPWVQRMARAAGTDEMEQMNQIREEFEAEYRERYKREAKN
jgi:hypothetical protein